MPHSPYTQIVQPPIHDLGSYARNLNSHRAQADEGHTDKYAARELLEIAEDLLEHCQFLDAKLDIKKRTNAELQQSLRTTKAELAKLQEQLKQLRDEPRSLEDSQSSSQLSVLKTGPQSANIELKPEQTSLITPPQHDRCDKSKPRTPTAGTLSQSHGIDESVIPQKRMREDS